MVPTELTGRRSRLRSTASEQGSGDLGEFIEEPVSPSAEVLSPAEVLGPLARHWRWIAGLAFCAALLVLLVCKLLIAQQFTATATIRPQRTGLTGLSSSLGGLVSGLTGGAAGSSSLEGGEGNFPPEELVSILESFDLNVGLAQKFHLGKMLLGSDWTASDARTRSGRWRLYRALRERLNCDLDYKTGNIDLSFLAGSPADAERTLKLYIDALRTKLRDQEVAKAKAAVAALEQAIGGTQDILLKQQLYALLAQQVQRESTARALAQFAFIVIDSPASPPNHSWPPTRRFCLIALFLGFFGSWAFFVMRDLYRAEGRNRGEEVDRGTPLPGREKAASRADQG